MYLARFAFGETDFITAVMSWTPAGSLVPRDWIHHLCAQTQIDLALRITSQRDQVRVALFLNADATAEMELRAACEALITRSKPVDFIVPENAAQFDELTSLISTSQMRVNHEGYHHRGLPLACNFRLYTALAHQREHQDAMYQINLKVHQPDSEVERRVLKHLTWLDLEKPFSDPVRQMQKTLVQRLRQRGWLADEYLVVQDSRTLDQCLGSIREHFVETTGRIGFTDDPLESGDFTDWLATGCHTERHAAVQTSLPSLGARIFDKEEVEWLLSANFMTGPAFSAVTRNAEKPDVFISYASSDFAFAVEVCRYLEERGVVCWIAPRDIERNIVSYPEALQMGLSQVRAVLVIVSGMANLSVHIPRELDIALERKLAIVPIRLEDVVPAGQLNYLLRTCQWLNAFGRPREDAMQELLSRMGKLLV